MPSADQVEMNGVCSEQRLAGQVAIITGGASGIGADTARLFLKQGARVFIADIQEPVKVEKLLRDLGPNAQYIQCNATKEDEVKAAWDKAYALENRLDIAFTNAGTIGPWGPVDTLNMEEYDAVVGLNLRAMVLGIKHSARLMKPKKKGSILCSASISSVLAGLGPLSYTVSKSGVIALVKSAATELAEFGIRVNALSVAGVATPLTASIIQKMAGDGAGQLSMDQVQGVVASQSLLPSRSLTGIDVANAALYLASDMAGYVSGHNLVIDAGLTVARSIPGLVWTTPK